MADINIFGTLHNVTGEPIVTADLVVDLTLNKDLEELNSIFSAAIAAGKVPLISVSELPTASADTVGAIYLVPSSNPETQNIKDEFVTIETTVDETTTYSWEQIGSTSIDLSGYELTSNKATDFTTVNNTKYPTVQATKTYVDAKIVDSSDGTSEHSKALSGHATQALLNSKQNTLVSGTNIRTINSSSILGGGNISIKEPISYKFSISSYTSLMDVPLNTTFGSVTDYVEMINQFKNEQPIDFIFYYSSGNTPVNYEVYSLKGYDSTTGYLYIVGNTGQVTLSNVPQSIYGFKIVSKTPTNIESWEEKIFPTFNFPIALSTLRNSNGNNFLYITESLTLSELSAKSLQMITENVSWTSAVDSVKECVTLSADGDMFFELYLEETGEDYCIYRLQTLASSGPGPFTGITFNN